MHGAQLNVSRHCSTTSFAPAMAARPDAADRRVMIVDIPPSGHAVHP